MLALALSGVARISLISFAVKPCSRPPLKSINKMVCLHVIPSESVTDCFRNKSFQPPTQLNLYCSVFKFLHL